MFVIIKIGDKNMNNNMYNNQYQQMNGQPVYEQPIYNNTSNNGPKLIVIIGIVIIVAIILSMLVYFNSKEDISKEVKSNDISGNYNCKGFSGEGESDEYAITLNLKPDYTFFYGPYGNTKNNYAKGTYSYEYQEKENNMTNYNYYMITFKGTAEDFVVDGKAQDHGFNSKMEFGVTTKDNKRQGIIMFVSNYNMYYCYEQ